MIEDLIDFIEIHPIVAFESHLRAHIDLFLELNLLRSTIVHNNAIQREAPSSPPRNAICLLYLPPKLVCIHQNFLHHVYTNLNSSFLDPSFLEWWLGCKTCIVYTGLKGKGLSPQVIFKKYFQICEFWRTQIQSLHCTCLLISSSSAWYTFLTFRRNDKSDRMSEC